MCISISFANESFDRLKFFESEIRPIFENNCVECHGGNKQKGGLSLHLKSLAFEGGDSGTPIKVGNAQDSLIIKAVERRNEDLEMPPKKALPADKVALLRRWIDAGAYWPEDKTQARRIPPAKNIAASRASHWAYQPIESSKEEGASIDKIIKKHLKTKNMTLSSRADARTLLRRVHFGLTGLPPTFEQVKMFQNKSSAQDYRKIIDKLLTQSEYGEHWGRHWLDVARYADTKGSVVVTAIKRYPFSYTYRDYVVKSFNEDLPYDQFIKEQLAADLIPELKDQKEKLAALGYITVGRRSRVKDDIIDERIDAVTRGFMATTVSCARCHDHKFDPISIKDYYAMYGVFKSLNEPKVKDLPIIGIPENQEDRDKFLKTKADYEKEFDEVKVGLKKKYEELHRKGMADYLNYYVKKDSKWKIKGEIPMQGKHVVLRRASIRTRNSHIKSLKADHFLFGPFVKALNLSKNNFTKSFSDLLNKYPKNSSSWMVSLLKKEHQAKPFKNLYEVSDFYGQFLLDHKKHDLNLDLKNKLESYVFKQWIEIPKHSIGGYLQVGPDLDKYKKIERKIETLMAESPGAPHRAMIVQENRHPHQPKVFIRGNSSRLGPSVSRRFLELLTPVTGGEKFNDQNSGRLALAKAIVHPKNPLTPRVMVNRIWAWHFGKPLVRTPSDFGLQTEKPLQMELLDFLADQFVQSGWSIKHMHRMIMNSQVYQQSSALNESNYAIDPDNQYLWRFNSKPLQYEQMRDAILKVTDRLNYEKGGRPLNLNTEHTKRAIYTLVNRNEIPEEYNVFGVADPNSTVAKRIDTLVPQQALYFMNNPFVIKQARGMISHPRLRGLNGLKWVSELYRLIFQREINPVEQELMLSFLKTTGIDRPLDRRYNWSYGYQDRKEKIDFIKLHTYSYDAFRLAKDKRIGGLKSLAITREGGDPGPSNFPNVRRWTSVVDGEIEIQQSLAHESEKGEGVKFQVLLNGKLIQEQVVYNSKKSMKLKLQVAQNDRVDFVTHCHTTHNHDFYKRHIQIKELGDEGRSWDSKKDYDGAVSKQVPYNNKLAIVQALLSSNEFNYLD